MCAQCKELELEIRKLGVVPGFFCSVIQALALRASALVRTLCAMRLVWGAGHHTCHLLTCLCVYVGRTAQDRKAGLCGRGMRMGQCQGRLVKSRRVQRLPAHAPSHSRASTSVRLAAHRGLCCEPQRACSHLNRVSSDATRPYRLRPPRCTKRTPQPNRPLRTSAHPAGVRVSTV